ncbi:MAG: branched-chain amino acid ABC transporter permease [Acidimicrobiia bacterium]|nr:branched-chain amino acid ABC transporter permease [Acidimicrobiia bacterium]
MRGRPNLYVSYQEEQALLPTWTKRVVLALFALGAVFIPLGGAIEVGERVIQPFGFLADGDWLRILGLVAITAVGALGLNILTGLAGQVSLGHAFFIGIGAYTAAVLGSPAAEAGVFAARWGAGLPVWVWLPAAGIVAAGVGALVAPTAVRVRGLYLAFVNLGLVFIGEWMFRTFVSVTGGSQSGRGFPPLNLRLWGIARDGQPATGPGLDLASDGPTWAPLAWLDWLLGPLINLPDEMSGEVKVYLALTAIAAVFVLLAKNLQRTRIGRSFMAVRDRDIAAEVMGVADAAAKTKAFAISSFYAGVSGALLGSFVGRLIPESFGLDLSVQFVAIILIGGAGTVVGTLLGTVFVVVLPRLVQDFSLWLTDAVGEGGFLAGIADAVVSTGSGDFGIVATSQGVTPGLNVAQLNFVLYGVLIIIFLIFEPLGLYGIWIRIRNYWKAWPFTY